MASLCGVNYIWDEKVMTCMFTFYSFFKWSIMPWQNETIVSTTCSTCSKHCIFVVAWSVDFCKFNPYPVICEYNSIRWGIECLHDIFNMIACLIHLRDESVTMLDSWKKKTLINVLAKYLFHDLLLIFQQKTAMSDNDAWLLFFIGHPFVFLLYLIFQKVFRHLSQTYENLWIR